ncbi:hypothetical protein RRG08_032969 [Elysia crispata]|uniref:Uncharacterized protein n=1 Tax=Elysia crispata TaxID=231223 RepID=A0AAE1D3K6_9GAST|nr:hypothetical protein RRG08_032969 [Elysia crispata]
MGVQPAQEVSGRIQGQGSMIYRPIVALPSGLHYSIEVGLEFDALEKGSEVLHTVQAAVSDKNYCPLPIIIVGIQLDKMTTGQYKRCFLMERHRANQWKKPFVDARPVFEEFDMNHCANTLNFSPFLLSYQPSL